MKIKIHRFEDSLIAELSDNEIVINTIHDAMDLLGNAGYKGASGIIIKDTQLCLSFFDLKTKLAGDILQKFSNYRMQLAIVGDFSKYKGKSLRNFIYESNKAGRIIFVPSFKEALQRIKLSHPYTLIHKKI